MKRRNFGMMAGGTAAVLSAGVPKAARAATVTAEQAATLKTTLTPMGAERAGNADGSIPAWTGGLTEVAAGWTEGMPQPDYFASDAALLTINASNVSQYNDMLPVGVVNMINKHSDFYVKVYPTHRTASAPQWVYDNTAQNAVNAKLDPRGGRFGFSGAYGGVPFPILDSDPAVAGPQVIWNHLTRWDGPDSKFAVSAYIISGGNISLGGFYWLHYHYPYYDPKGSVATFNGWFEYIHLDYIAPPVLVGQVLMEWSPTNALVSPSQAWELLNGQGRVRKAPELTYDTPTATGGGITSYDESYGFYGSPDRYNWTYLGKKEMYIPYNNNALANSDPNKSIGPEFIDPAVCRFEKHRVHVIDAVLAPGARHVIPHRRFYVDEDNWHIAAVDEYDAAGNYIKLELDYNINVPNAPGTLFLNSAIYNLQTGQYTMGTGAFCNAQYPGYIFGRQDPKLFNPQDIAAQGQY